MMHNEDHEGTNDHMEHMCHMAGPFKKEFKLAMLEKKEKIIEAKLEFIKKIKELVKKSQMDK